MWGYQRHYSEGKTRNRSTVDDLLHQRFALIRLSGIANDPLFVVDDNHMDPEKMDDHMDIY